MANKRPGNPCWCNYLCFSTVMLQLLVFDVDLALYVTGCLGLGCRLAKFWLLSTGIIIFVTLVDIILLCFVDYLQLRRKYDYFLYYSLGTLLCLPVIPFQKICLKTCSQVDFLFYLAVGGVQVCFMSLWFCSHTYLLMLLNSYPHSNMIPKPVS